MQSRIGWTVETARVLAEGEKVEDDWLVLGRVIEPDDHLTVRRLWLRGSSTGRLALILNFAPVDASSTHSQPAGRASPGRALLLPRRAADARTADPDRATPACSTPRRLQRETGLGLVRRIAGGRSLERALALVLADVRPARNGENWALVDETGDALEVLPGVDLWKLLAVSAGDPITVAGEWNRAGFKPMTCWDGDRPVILS